MSELICVVLRCGRPRVDCRHLCVEHYAEWRIAPEHARADSALADFVRRLDAEQFPKAPAATPPPNGAH